MLKKSLLVVLVGMAASADQTKNACIEYYQSVGRSGVAAAIKETKKKASKEVKSRLTPAENEIVDKIHMKHLESVFETEFSVNLNDNFLAMLKKVLFDPESMTREEWSMLREGEAYKLPNGQEHVGNSLLKSYLNLNHLTVPNQEAAAETVLTALRQKDIPASERRRIQLTQLELVALRISRVIGRDYDMLAYGPYAKSEAEIKKMKYRFLSLFAFNGKQLTPEEFEVLYAKKVVVDDPMADSRYDLAQTYDPAVVTKESIQLRNKRRLEQTHEWKNEFNAKNEKEIREDVALRASDFALERKLEEDKDLLGGLRFVRQQVLKKLKKHNNFSTKEKLAEFLKEEKRDLELGLSKLSEPEMKEKLDFLLDGLTVKTGYQAHVRKIKAKLDLTNPEHQKIQEFLDSNSSRNLFFIAREELRYAKPRVRGVPSFLGKYNLTRGAYEWLTKRIIPLDVMEKAFQRNLDKIDAVLKYENTLLFDVIHRTKIVRTELDWAEVNEIFNIMTYDSHLRLASLVKYDPTSSFGFCFGRAHFGNLILEHHGVHKDSRKKVFVYGPMSGGLFGWGFHVAQMVAKKGGGFWVLDPSHGKPETLEDWFAHYIKASKDGRIKMDITDGDRFGRSFWGTPDFNGNLASGYESVWNKVLGTNLKYFKDGMEHLEKNNFDRERTSMLRDIVDDILDASDVGI